VRRRPVRCAAFGPGGWRLVVVCWLCAGCVLVGDLAVLRRTEEKALVLVGRACGELAVVLAESVQSAWDCRRRG
jgi:hypothetical protein